MLKRIIKYNFILLPLFLIKNYSYSQNIQEQENIKESNLDILSDDFDSAFNFCNYNSRNHKCKKSKCFCRLNVKKEIKSSSLSTGAVKLDTLNGAYPITSSTESFNVVKGTIFFAENPQVYAAAVKYNPASSSVPFAYYDIQVGFNNNLSNTSIPVGKIKGEGFKVGNAFAYAADLAASGFYQSTGSLLPNIDAICVVFTFVVNFDKPFKSEPSITATFATDAPAYLVPFLLVPINPTIAMSGAISVSPTIEIDQITNSSFSLTTRVFVIIPPISGTVPIVLNGFNELFNILSESFAISFIAIGN